MVMRNILIGLVGCILIALFAGGAPAQVYRQYRTEGAPMPPPNPEEMQRKFEAETAAMRKKNEIERQQRMKQMLQDAPQRSREIDRQRDEAIRKALRASEQQWRTIQPKFNRVRDLMRQARFGLVMVGFNAGGSSGGSSQMGGGNSSRPGGTSATIRGSAGSDGGMGGAGGSSGGFTVGGEGWKPLGDPNSTEASSGIQSGWKLARPSDNKKPNELSAGERAAESLLDSLEKEPMRPEEIQGKLAAFRKARETAAQQLLEAQKELRKTLTAEQESMMALMGYLE